MGKFIGIGAGAVVEKDGQVEGLGGLVQVEEKRQRATPVQVDGKEIFLSQTPASKPNPKWERRRIRKESKGSKCAGKRGGDRATSNAQ